MRHRGRDLRGRPWSPDAFDYLDAPVERDGRRRADGLRDPPRKMSLPQVEDAVAGFLQTERKMYSVA